MIRLSQFQLFAIAWLGFLGFFCIWATAGMSEEIKDPGSRGSGRVRVMQAFTPQPNKPPTNSIGAGTR